MEYFKGFKSDPSISDEHVEEVIKMMNENNSKVIEFPGTYPEVITTKNIDERNKSYIDNKKKIAKTVATLLIAGGIGFGSMAAFDKLHDDSKYAPDPNTPTMEEYIDYVNEVKSNGGDIEVSEQGYQNFIDEHTGDKGGRTQ